MVLVAKYLQQMTLPSHTEAAVSGASTFSRTISKPETSIGSDASNRGPGRASIIMASLTLFHSSDLPLGFVSDLAANGITTSTIEVLRFEFDEFRPDLANCLANAHDYAGIVLPSPRAVEALSYVRHLVSPSAEFYCVGPKTAAELQDRLGLTATLIGTKGASELSGLIIERLKAAENRSVVSISGDLQSPGQAAQFEAEGIKVWHVVGYSTKEVDPLPLAAAISQVLPLQALETTRTEYTGPSHFGYDSALKDCQAGPYSPTAVVFFSPSGARAVLAASRLGGNWDWSHIKLFSIGETTGRAVVELFGRCDGWPESSNIESIKQMAIASLTH
jgi:uroporphyrinogen-III synthase